MEQNKSQNSHICNQFIFCQVVKAINRKMRVFVTNDAGINKCPYAK